MLRRSHETEGNGRMCHRRGGMGERASSWEQRHQYMKQGKDLWTDVSPKIHVSPKMYMLKSNHNLVALGGGVFGR